MTISKHIEEVMENQGRSLIWVTQQINEEYKPFWYRLKNDRLTSYDLLKVSKILNIDLNKLKEEI